MPDDHLTPQQKAARTTKLRHGDNFHKRIGTEAGRVSQAKRKAEGKKTGFELMDQEKRRAVAKKGGKAFKPSEIRVIDNVVINDDTGTIHRIEEDSDPMDFIADPRQDARITRPETAEKIIAAQLKNLGERS